MAGMKKRSAQHRIAQARIGARHAVVLCVLLGACACVGATPPQGRLDPAERQQLRHELRQQAMEERRRMHHYPPQPDAPGAPPASPGVGGQPGRYGYGGPAGSPGAHPPGRPPGLPADGAGPGWGAGDGWRSHPPRLSPEEREQLRHMLRERGSAGRGERYGYGPAGRPPGGPPGDGGPDR